jgi:hypothetical protein
MLLLMQVITAFATDAFTNFPFGAVAKLHLQNLEFCSSFISVFVKKNAVSIGPGLTV